MKREPAQVVMLPRQPGTKESRYAHLLSGPIDVSAWESAAPAIANSPDAARMASLEEEVAALRTEVAELKQQLADFRSQFS
jgi:uncharacterized protein YceH (UPF0502 family)